VFIWGTTLGATENAGVENAGVEMSARKLKENTGVENAGVAAMERQSNTEGEVDATCVQFGSRGEEFHPQGGRRIPQIYGSY